MNELGTKLVHRLGLRVSSYSQEVLGVGLDGSGGATYEYGVLNNMPTHVLRVGVVLRKTR